MKKKNLKSLRLNKERVSELNANSLKGGRVPTPIESAATDCKYVKACQYLSLYLPINYCY